jgi:hypothetical protein
MEAELARVQIGWCCGSRPLVTAFMLSKTSTQGTQPRATQQSTSPRNSVSWRMSAVKRTQVQRLYLSRQARK